MIEKTYQPAEIEPRISAAWERVQAFRAGRPERRAATPYCIVIPPPNITGSLHLGHALDNTLQDVLCRFERMRGKDVLWQVGTDHAGIATQMVVERQLMERQEPSRREMGREKFLERVWAWKAESGGTIINQLKRLGASCDWSRERFTMGERGAPDEQMVRAVLKAFVELYKAGLIYKDKRLVNWDPKLLTAISDLEVQQVECRGSFKWSSESGEPLDAVALGKVLDRDPNGHLYYFRYPLEGKAFDPSNPSTFITVATTRPETMLGDVAVAVHPDDERYKPLVGKNVILPLVGRKIPIIADEYSDPEKGTGAVKITPAHDFNDFEVGKRHSLPQVIVITTEARITTVPIFAAYEHYKIKPDDDPVKPNATFSSAPDATLKSLDGSDRFVARKKIVALLEECGFIDKIEPTVHMVPHGDRSGVVIEPYLTDQWYVDAKTLAAPALAAVNDGRTTFVPRSWEKTYFEWMENIQPWCISRQLWWGHQIPAWYGKEEDIFVELSEADAIAAAEKKYNKKVVVASSIFGSDVVGNVQAVLEAKSAGYEVIARDEDVLDTWFSSALWPFSTLGWPDETPELKRYYPTSVLVTGFDIIFFWVARMMMMGLHFMKEVPFHTVYIHALVRDERGAKMSKSKGNVVDPLGIIDDYGADALRFTLALMAAQGRDIRLSPARVEGERNFATKLWNACRFAEMNACAGVAGFNPKSAKEVLNRWIAHETARTARDVTAALEAYRFNDAAGAVRAFVWNVYCDWYLELAKPVLTGPDGAAKSETRAMVAWARDEILKLLHPFMPFLTEELWAVTAGASARAGLLTLTPWPAYAGLDDPAAEAEIGWVVDLVSAIRSIRAEMNIAPATQLPLVLAGVSAQTKARAERWMEFIGRLARVGDISFAQRAPDGAVQLLVRGEVAALPLKGVIDLAAERARLEKEMAKAMADIQRVDAKLANPDFVKRAPEEIIDGEREKREEAEGRRQKIVEALGRLGAMS